MAFSMHMNQCLGRDPHCARHLPLGLENMDLFEKTHDGILLCKLINQAQHDAIDERAINTKAKLNVYNMTENINLALNAAKSIGCQVVNIGAQDIMEGRPHLVLGLVWQIIKIQLLSQISLKECPELVALLEEGETLAAFIKLHPEIILLRWVNYHLRQAGSTRVIHNFGSDISDSEAYSILLNQLKPSTCRLITDTDRARRAGQVLSNARAMGVDCFIQPRDIVDGNKKLNLTFAAQVFNTCHGLTVSEEQKAGVDLSTLVIDDAGDSREERVLRMWINSLNIENTYVQDLFSDLDDGVVILRVVDIIQPGAVEWRRVSLETKSRYKKVENSNLAVTLSRDRLGLSVVNCGGLDIVDGNKKIILAIISQLMRKYTLGVLARLASASGAAEMTDEQITGWANDKVAASGKTSRMRNFKDKSLSNSRFLLELIAAIDERAVEWEVVSAGTSEEEKMLNAKYAISAARKLGACVFITPEDVVEVKSKMLVTFLAGVWAAEMQRV